VKSLNQLAIVFHALTRNHCDAMFDLASAVPPERPPMTGLAAAFPSRNTMPKPSMSPASSVLGMTTMSARVVVTVQFVPGNEAGEHDFIADAEFRCEMELPAQHSAPASTYFKGGTVSPREVQRWHDPGVPFAGNETGDGDGDRSSGWWRSRSEFASVPGRRRYQSRVILLDPFRGMPISFSFPTAKSPLAMTASG